MRASQPRKVLYITPSSRLLGARRSLLGLVESLDPERWQPVVCAQSYGQLGEALEQRDIPLHIVKLGWWRKGKYFLWRPFAIARLAAVARQEGVDLIHCNELYSNPYAVRAAQSIHTPSAEEAAAEFEAPRTGNSLPVLTHVRLGMKPGMIRKYDLGRADRIVVPSEALAHEFDEWRNRQERVKVIYNGVNLEEFQRGRSPEEARRLLGLQPDKFTLAAIGQLGPRKGGDIILDAFSQIAARYPQTQLFFAGDAHRGQEEFAEQLRDRASSPPLSGRVHFFPFSSEVLPFYEATDINLLVSRSEGFGRTIIEAGAVGVPSIGARTGGIEEIIAHPHSGLLIPPEDPDALAEAMSALIGDPGKLREMANAAFRRTAQFFSIAAHSRQIMDLYDEIIEARSPNP